MLVHSELAAPLPNLPAEDSSANDAGNVAVAMEAEVPRDGEPSAIWPDDSAESSFLADLRERGETPSTTPDAEVTAEDSDAKALPPLDDLVQRIPTAVREVLDELFRARFVTVRRVPKKSLKR